jgi:hypothetical protein
MDHQIIACIGGEQLQLRLAAAAAARAARAARAAAGCHCCSGLAAAAGCRCCSGWCCWLPLLLLGLPLLAAAAVPVPPRSPRSPHAPPRPLPPASRWLPPLAARAGAAGYRCCCSGWCCCCWVPLLLGAAAAAARAGAAGCHCCCCCWVPLLLCAAAAARAASVPAPPRSTAASRLALAAATSPLDNNVAMRYRAPYGPAAQSAVAPRFRRSRRWCSRTGADRARRPT